MFLPDEIINLILSYREVNPVALLISESIKDLNGCIFDSYYKNALLDNKEKEHLSNISRLDKYLEDKYRIIKSKKLTKKLRISRNNKILNNYCNKQEEYRREFIKFYNDLTRRLSEEGKSLTRLD